MAQAYKPINGGGLQLYPFNAHKRWIVTDTNYRNDLFQYSIVKGISPLYKELVPLSQSVNMVNVADDSQLDNTNSNNKPYLAKKEQKVIWSGLNQTFFKHRPNNERDLFASASVFSIPMNRLGDGILPGSVIIQDKSQSDLVEYVDIIDRKIDEMHGYLIDTSLNTSSYAPFGDLMGYWGFNDELIPRSSSFDNKIEDRSGYQNHAVGREVYYGRGIKTSGTASITSGTKIGFNGENSYLKIDYKPRYSPVKENDYSLSIWTELPVSQSNVSSNYNWIINKNGTSNGEYKSKRGDLLRRQVNVVNPIFPYDLKVYNQSSGVGNSGKLVASLSNGVRNVEVTSSTAVNDGNQHHIVFNKTGSLLELWVDGTKEASSSINLKGDVWNENDLLLGSQHISDLKRYGRTPKSLSKVAEITSFNTMTGSLDEFRYYRKALSSTEIKGLSSNDWNTGSAYQEDIVGEVFYKQGIVVVSDPRPKYKNVLVGNGDWNYDSNRLGFTTKYKSTKKLYETSVMCEVGSSEFNISTNVSLRKNNDIRESFLKPFVTGSDFSPYFTSIGLYNKDRELIAIGKLASAIQVRQDVDITVKVRLDMDGPFGTPMTGSLLPESENNIKLQERPDGNFTWNPQGF